MNTKLISKTAVFLLALSLAGCSGAQVAQSAKPEITKTSQVPTTDTADEDKDVNGASVDDLESYLTSTERKAQYTVTVTMAGALLARILELGEFGETARYTEDLDALEPGYIGWGGISAVPDMNGSTTRAYARVWWNADGSIDYSKPVTQLTLGKEGDSTYSSVFISGPTEDNDYWTGYVAEGALTYTNSDALQSVRADGWLSLSEGEDSSVHTPTSLEEFKQFDQMLLNELNQSMADYFGENWAG